MHGPTNPGHLLTFKMIAFRFPFIGTESLDNNDLKLCLAQWPASEKRCEPGVLREQLGHLFRRYPGLQLLTMDALYAERDLHQVINDN